MMFCWLHLILTLLFLKALWVVMAAAATLRYSDKEALLEKDATLKSDGAMEHIQLHSGKTVLRDMSSLNEDLNLHYETLDRTRSYNLKIEEGDFIDSKETDISARLNAKTDCDEFCKHIRVTSLSSDIHLKNSDKTRMVSSDLSSKDDHIKESKLIERDVSSTYELDNHNENFKYGNENNTNSEETIFRTVKRIDNQNTELQGDITPLSPSIDKVGSSVSPVGTSEDQTTIPSTLSVSNNRTVGMFNPNLNNNDSSAVSVEKMKVVPNYNTEGFTSSGEKINKGSSVNLKIPVKSNKNRTLQEIKPGPQVKYSDESKKKTFVKSLIDSSGGNISQQHSDVPQSIEDSSILMNDEPENVSGQTRNHGFGFVPSDDEGNLEFSQLDIINTTAGGVNASVLETNETFSTAAHGHMMKTIEESSLNIAVISAIAIGILVISSMIGAISFVVYRHRYWNKPHTLSDKCSNADSSGYIDDSTLRDNSEEMYSLDNDSFLNSLEAMTIQNYWTDNVKHTKL